MKNKYLFIGLLCFLFVLAIPFLIPILISTDFTFVTDYSGVRHADSFLWNDIEYIYAPGRYHEGKTIAKTDDGFSIVEVKEDPSHTFLVLRSFLDNDFYVREDYEIPTSGDITVAYWDYKTITDKSFLSALTSILEENKVDLEYQTAAPYSTPDGSDMRVLYVGYDACPVATSNLGYLGTINGVWYITTGIVELSAENYQISCARIPQEYIPIFKQFSS